MKVYTKKGDLGKTSIIGESNIDKHNIRIEAYGTVDELNSVIGLLRSFNHQNFDKHIKELIFIQNCLFTIGSVLASTMSIASTMNSINSSDIKTLEKFIDSMQLKLQPLDSFILPGGDIWIGYAHLSRSICRRAERRITFLNMEQKIDQRIITFINRLSDYFFVLARQIHDINNIDELKWNR